MLQSIKRLTKHSAVYGVGHIVSRFIGFLLLPIHTNIFLPEQYRTPALLFSSLAILNVIFSYGMDVAFLRFFILADSKDEKHRIFSTAFLMILGTGVCFAGFMILNPTPFSRLIFRSGEYVLLIRLAGGILLADALCLLPFLILRAEERSARFILIKTLNIVFNFGLNILFVVVLKKDIAWIFVANLMASVFTLMVLLPIIFRWLRGRFSKAVLADLFRFGLPYVPSTLAVILMDQIGRFFLDRMVGEEATGVFSAGYKLGMFMALVVAAFRFAWHPYFLSTAREQPDDAPRIFARILTYFLLATGFVFLVLSFFIEEIVGFRVAGFGLVGEEYGIGAQIVPVVMMAYIAYGVYTHFIVGIYLKKKTIVLPLITGVGALVSIAGNFLLVPFLGIMGAAWAAFFAYAAMAAALFFVSRRLYPIPYEWFRILKLIFLFAAAYAAGSVLSAIWIQVAILFVFPVLLWLLRFFNEEERAFIRQRIITP